LERETGIEPATNSLEGCDSTTELLPPARGIRQSILDRTESSNRFAPVSSTRPATSIGGERRIRTSVARKERQIYSLLPLTTRPSLQYETEFPVLDDVMAFWSWRRDLNPRPADYKSAALPTELRQPVGKTRNLAESPCRRNREFNPFLKTLQLRLPKQPN
jgi:hypothetical protein